MRAILINDTRSDHHVGCQLVVENTLRLCQAHDINIVTTVTNADALEAEKHLQPFLADCDLLLLNGEGTLHHDKPKALSLLKAAVVAKQQGLRTVLYNALWRDNSEANIYLKHFDQIYCRDSESAIQINEHAHCTMVPDMVFATEYNVSLSQKSGVLVTDSVKKQVSRQLAKYAIKHRHSFTPMGAGFDRCLKGKPVLAWKLSRYCQFQRGDVPTTAHFIQQIQSAERVITGRFHTACLALLTGTPVACIQSNTSKIESLFRDFGLPETLAEIEDLNPAQLELQWQAQIEQKHDISAAVQQAKQQIEAMFASFHA